LNWKNFYKKTFQKLPNETVAGAALVVSVAGIFSRILGLIRDRILASSFGAGDVLDIYYAAFRLPDLVYNFLIVGALNAAFIPVFTDLIVKKKKQEAWQLSQSLLILEIVTMLFIGIILFLFIYPLIHLIAPGFSFEKLEKTIIFTKIMFLSPFFLGISAIFGSILVSFKRFLAFSLAPIFYNLGIIFGILVLVPILGDIGLAWGVVLGAFLHMLIQIGFIKQIDFRFQRKINWSLIKNDLKKIIILMLPRSLAMGVSQINLLIITIFASTLTAGSLAVFNLANNIQSIPLGLFSIPFAVAVFPLLSSLSAENNFKKFSHILTRTIRRILFFIVPISLFFFVLRAEIVRVILGGGKFNWNDTLRTLSVLGVLVFSLFAQALIPLFSRAFYSLQDTKTPFFIALISEFINLLSLFIFIKRWGVIGLALAFSLSSIINTFLLLFFLRKIIIKKDLQKTFFSVKKIFLTSLLASIVIYLTRYLISYFIILNTFWAVLFQLVVAGILGVVSFYLIAEKFKIQELKEFKTSFKIKLLGKENDSLENI